MRSGRSFFLNYVLHRNGYVCNVLLSSSWYILLSLTSLFSPKNSFFSTTFRSFFHPAYSDALSKFFQAHLHNHACQPDELIRIGHNIRMQKLRVRMRNFFKENPNENIRRKKIISMTGKWKKNARKCFRLSGESSRW